MPILLDIEAPCFICKDPILSDRYFTGSIDIPGIGEKIVAMHTKCAEKHNLDVCGNCQKIISRFAILNWDYHTCNKCIGTVRLKKEKPIMPVFIRKIISLENIGFAQNLQKAYFEAKCEMTDGTIKTKYGSSLLDFTWWSDEQPEIDILLSQNGKPVSNISRKEDVYIDSGDDGESFVWCDADLGNEELILRIPGVAEVYRETLNTLNNTAEYDVWFDPRYDQKTVENNIKITLLSKPSRK